MCSHLTGATAEFEAAAVAVARTRKKSTTDKLTQVAAPCHDQRYQTFSALPAARSLVPLPNGPSYSGIGVAQVMLTTHGPADLRQMTKRRFGKVRETQMTCSKQIRTKICLAIRVQLGAFLRQLCPHRKPPHEWLFRALSPMSHPSIAVGAREATFRDKVASLAD